MDDILSRIASFARNPPPVRTTAAATKCPASSTFIETTICQGNNPDRPQTAASSHFSKSALLCFSKDRPYQLEQFLISSKMFLSLDKIALKIFVLYSPGRFPPLIVTSAQFYLWSIYSWLYPEQLFCWMVECYDAASTSRGCHCLFECIVFCPSVRSNTPGCSLPCLTMLLEYALTFSDHRKLWK